jgi:hypothetical protein
MVMGRSLLRLTCGDQVAISINIGRDAYLQERPQLGAPVSKFRRVG